MMAKVSIRVQSGAVRFDVAGTTDSPERATGLIRDSYRAGDIRLRLPTDLERFPQSTAPQDRGRTVSRGQPPWRPRGGRAERSREGA